MKIVQENMIPVKIVRWGFMIHIEQAGSQPEPDLIVLDMPGAKALRKALKKLIVESETGAVG